MKVDFYTKQNSKGYNKPNEDYIHIAEKIKIYIILDGVSRDLEDGRYPNPSPSLEASKTFAITTAHYLEHAISCLETNPSAALKQAIEHGNRHIHTYNTAYNHSFLPGTVGIISCIVDSIFYYGYIGDCIGTFNSTPFTSPQTARIRANKHKYTSAEIRYHICNNIDHPCSYGVLNGTQQALAFVQYGSFKVAQGDIILMMTDGMEQLYTYCGPNGLQHYTCKELVDIVEALEKGPQDSDDKSILRLII